MILTKKPSSCWLVLIVGLRNHCNILQTHYYICPDLVFNIFSWTHSFVHAAGRSMITCWILGRRCLQGLHWGIGLSNKSIGILDFQARGFAMMEMGSRSQVFLLIFVSQILAILGQTNSNDGKAFIDFIRLLDMYFLLFHGYYLHHCKLVNCFRFGSYWVYNPELNSYSWVYSKFLKKTYCFAFFNGRGWILIWLLPGSLSAFTANLKHRNKRIEICSWGTCKIILLKRFCAFLSLSFKSTYAVCEISTFLIVQQ